MSNTFPNNGLAFEEYDDHFDGNLVPFIEREAEERTINGMEIQEEEEEKQLNGVIEVEVDFEIWPVEHPMEPPDEDRPVKCPMPESSVINVSKFSHNEEGKREKRLAESLRKRTEEQSRENKSSSPTVQVERPVRAVRKRHHNLTGGDDHVIVPSSRMPPLPTQNLTIFKMLQQIDKFEP